MLPSLFNDKSILELCQRLPLKSRICILSCLELVSWTYLHPNVDVRIETPTQPVLLQTLKTLLTELLNSDSHWLMQWDKLFIICNVDIFLLLISRTEIDQLTSSVQEKRLSYIPLLATTHTANYGAKSCMEDSCQTHSRQGP